MTETTDKLLHELRHPRTDFPTYLTDLAARAATEIERLNALLSGKQPPNPPGDDAIDS